MAVIMSEILESGSQLAFAAFAGKQHLAADRKPGETVLAGNFSAPGYPPAVLLMRFSTQKPIKNAILVLLKRFQKIRTRKLV